MGVVSSHNVTMWPILFKLTKVHCQFPVLATLCGKSVNSSVLAVDIESNGFNSCPVTYFRRDHLFHTAD